MPESNPISYTLPSPITLPTETGHGNITIENAIRWEAPYLNRACKPNSLENSNIEKLWALNQQLSTILLVLVIAVPYVRFIAPMTFCVLSMLATSKKKCKNFHQPALLWPILPWSFLALFLAVGFSCNRASHLRLPALFCTNVA
jgi:hypothetical protein